MKNFQNTLAQIEVLLYEVRDLISAEIGKNSYEDLDKSIKIVSQKNYKQVPAIKDKLKNLSMMLYNRNLNNSKLIFDKLDKVYSLLLSISSVDGEF